MPICWQLLDAKITIFNNEKYNKLTQQTARQTFQLSKLKVNNFENTILLISKILNEFRKLINANLTEDDIAYYAKFILNEYWYLTIEDLILILKNGILGKYGKVYGEFKFINLTEWINIYWNEWEQNCDFGHENKKEARNDKLSGIKLLDNLASKIKSE